MTAVLACALSGAALAALAAFHFAERKDGEAKGPAFFDSWLNWFLLCAFIASSLHIGLQTWIGAGLPANAAHERVAAIERMIDQASVRAKPFLSVGEIPQAALLLALMMLAVIGLRKTAAMAAAGVERGLKLAGRVYVFLAVLASFTFFAGEAGRFVEARIANARATLQGAVLGHSDLARESRELAFDTIALSILESRDVEPAITRLAGAMRETQQIEDARRYAEMVHEGFAEPERRNPSTEAETARRRIANEFGIDSVRAAGLAVREPAYESGVFAPPLSEMTPQEISARAQWVQEQRELTATALYSEDEAEKLLKDAVRKLVAAAWSAGPGKEIAAALQSLAPNAPAELMRQVASKLVGKPIKDAVSKMAAFLARRMPLGAEAAAGWASAKALAVATLRDAGAYDLHERLSAWDSALAARLAAMAGDRTRAENELRAVLDIATARLEAQVGIPAAPELERAARRALRSLSSAAASTDPLTTIRRDIEACESIADDLRPIDTLDRLEWIAANEEETLRRSGVHDALASLRTANAPWFTGAASPAVRNFVRWAETAQPHGDLIWRHSFGRTAFAAWLNGGGKAQNIDAQFVEAALRGDVTTAALLDYARIVAGNGAEGSLVSAAISVRDWAQKQTTQVYNFQQFRDPGETIAQLRRLLGSQELATEAARNERSEALELPIALALMQMGLGGRLTAEARESVRRFRREMTAEHAQNPEMWAAAAFPALAAAAAAASDRRRIESSRSSAESRPQRNTHRRGPMARPAR